MSNSPQQIPGFDSAHPLDRQLINACVHCGFCLSTCPSYRILGKETDSPRGRIYLMAAIDNGEIPLSPAVVEHFDSCLGCLACVTTCPSGVQYDQLIAAMRPQIERNHPRSWQEKLLRQFIFQVFPYPERLKLLLAPLITYQKLGIQNLIRKSGILNLFLPKQIAAMESVLPTISATAFNTNYPAVIPAQGQTRFRVGMILGCVQRLFLPEVNAATIRVLTANGCEVLVPPQQGCCGALTHHQGQEAQTADFARQMIDIFAPLDLDAILINASGCGHSLKLYDRILEDDPDYATAAQNFAQKVKDVQEFLDEVGLITPLAPISPEPLTMVYQDACHMLHGQQISMQPRRLLKQIPHVNLTEPMDAALCCGSAGVYNILQPEIGTELGKQKVENLVNTKATVIASSNVGCTMQIRKHLELQGHSSVLLRHPMELLDYAIRGVKI